MSRSNYCICWKAKFSKFIRDLNLIKGTLFKTLTGSIICPYYPIESDVNIYYKLLNFQQIIATKTRYYCLVRCIYALRGDNI